MVIESLLDKSKNWLEKVLDKWEKAAVKSELLTFAQWNPEISVANRTNLRLIYREALKNPRLFREILDGANKSPFDPMTSTWEILNKPTVSERRYYQKRGRPVPTIGLTFLST